MRPHCAPAPRWLLNARSISSAVNAPPLRACAALVVERQVDDRVVVEVDHTVVVEVAVAKAGQMIVEPIINPRVIIEVDQSVVVGVASEDEERKRVIAGKRIA